ncbi:MAG: DUF362 domain-containing protein [Acidobacteriota bacterium]|nr:DUF362 domain-containing protein [Acidobacteriota bacterium]
MDRRTFVGLLAAAPLVSTVEGEGVPKYRIVSDYRPASVSGMPGLYPGKVIAVKSAKCLDASGDKINAEIVREMMARGMRELTGEAREIDAWRRFFEPSDVVGIKVNCGGHPWVVSSHEIVAEAVRNLITVGVKPSQIYVYERFQNQLDAVHYAPHLPAGVQIVAAERANRNIDNSGYDPATYVEADFFGEEDTRSNMMRLVTERLTKIINIPNMKDHGATGVTGCLKNIAYGSFSNVARTHQRGKSHTLSFVGTLAGVEPLRSRTVLQIMDGLRGVWHGGPFARGRRYVFYPKQIMFGTDPVAIDRLLLDIIDDKRKAEGAISVWDRSPKNLNVDNGAQRDQNPNVNIIIREPGHVEYASKLGLGVHDLSKISVREIQV